MGLIFIRTTIIFLALFAVMRLMGKRQIGEMQPYELVITLIISELACIPMADNSIPLLYGIVAILTVYFLHQVVCLIDLNFRASKTVLSGTPSIVLNKNGIDDTQLKKNNLDVSDLIESMRGAGYFSLDDVEYALYESNGKFSALAKAKEGKEGAAENAENPSLPVLLVCEGKFNDKNLRLIGKEKGYFLEKLRGQGFNELKKLLVMTVDGAGKVYAQESGQSYRVFSLGWQERLW